MEQWGRNTANRREGCHEDPEEEAGPLRKTESYSGVEVGRRRVRVETCPGVRTEASEPQKGVWALCCAVSRHWNSVSD